MEVKKSLLIIFVILFAGLVLLGLSDTHISIADTDINDSETTRSVSKASNSSTSAVITITMYAVVDAG